MRKIKHLLILAGGDSTRFWPLSEKNFMKFFGEELILHQIKNIMPYAEEIYVVVSNKNYERMRRLTKTLNESIEVLTQSESLAGQAGAILSAKGRIKGEALIINGNDFFDYGILPEFIKKIDEEKPSVLLLSKKVDSYFPGGYVRFRGKKVVGIIEKPPINKTPSDFVRLVVDYFLDFDELATSIEEIHTSRDNWYEAALNSLIKKTNNVNCFIYNNYWYSLKYPWHVLPLLNFYLRQITKNTIEPGVIISPHACIVAPVFIKKGVKVGDFSKIVGPCYIDENTIVGDHVLIRGSHIGRNALIGGNCEIARSYIADSVMLHRNYVGDSVLDTGVLFGAGAVTANYRFDGKEVLSMVNHQKINTRLTKFGSIVGKNSKIGVNASIFPGIKIGVNTFVAPGCAVCEDIGNNCFMDGSIRKNHIIK